MKTFFNHSAGVLAGILLCSLAVMPALANDPKPKTLIGVIGDPDDQSATAPAPRPPKAFFRTVATDDYRPSSKEMPWLGVGVAESSEPLSAQLDLKPGEGLVVTFVATNSPAAEAGLQKNDVLVELDGQMLVDAIQLRKLVQMHSDGDSVKIEFYRAGKKQSTSAKLKLRAFEESSIDGDILPYRIQNRVYYSPNLPPLPPLDKGKLNIQVQQATVQAKRAMEQAQLTVEEALRQSQNADGLNRQLWTIQKKLGDLADGGVKLRKDATVIVKDEGASVRTIVKKDASGTYVVVADPAKHLTAHDSNSKLLFDGPIESPEQQQKVPKKIWSKIQPMLEQLDEPAAAAVKLTPEENPEEEE